MRSMTLPRLFFLSVFLLGSLLFPQPAELKSESSTNIRFAISFPETSSNEPLDGRVLLLVSTDNSKEPRFQINEDLNTQQVFGVDVDALKPGQEAVVDANAFGYPLSSLSQLKPGDYWVQALLHRYETFKRSDGPHRQAADGSRRGPAVESRAGKSLQHAAKDNGARQ